jgi:hypothetical protein
VFRVRPDEGRPESTLEEAVDVRFAVAVAAHEFGAQRVESVESFATVRRHLGLEFANGIGEGIEFCLVEFFETSETEFGAYGIELVGKRVVAEILCWTRRPSRAAGQVL